MCFKSSTKHILNDNPSMGSVKRYLGTCKNQALGLNVDHVVINGNVSLGYKYTHGRHWEVSSISGSLSFVFTCNCICDIEKHSYCKRFKGCESI